MAKYYTSILVMGILYNRHIRAFARTITRRCRFRLIVLTLILVLFYLFVIQFTRPCTTSYRPADCYKEKPKLSYMYTKPSVNVTSRIEVFPKEWTGETVDISKDFNPDIFNGFCQRFHHLKAVLPIYSSVEKFEKRKLLRESLGRLAEKLGCRIFFIVGMSRNAEINRRLQDEYTWEQDILVYGKIDKYRDLNNKAAAMVEWIDKYCLNVSYVIHLIDDAYINLERWLRRLDEIPDLDYILGLWADTPSERRYWLFKSYVTVEEYPYQRFPIYAYGFAFAFSSRTATRLRSAMYNATYCWIEDVWIAGHVRETAGVKLIPLKDSEWGQGNWTCRRRKPLSNFMLWHAVNGDDLKKAYLCSYINKQ